MWRFLHLFQKPNEGICSSDVTIVVLGILFSKQKEVLWNGEYIGFSLGNLVFKSFLSVSLSLLLILVVEFSHLSGVGTEGIISVLNQQVSGLITALWTWKLFLMEWTGAPVTSDGFFFFNWSRAAYSVVLVSAIQRSESAMVYTFVVV